MTKQKSALHSHAAPTAAIRCPVCQSAECSESFRSYRGPVHRCAHCRVYFVVDNGLMPPGQETMFYAALDEERYKAYFKPFRSGQYRHVLKQLRVRAGATLLDIGASYGWMVQVASDLGFDSYGLEPGEAPCDPRLAGRMFRESLATYSNHANRTFDVITIWHVLEHLPSPVSAMAQIDQLLVSGGTPVIAVPTADGWMFRMALLLNRLAGSKRLLNELFYFHNINMHFTYPSISSVQVLLQQRKYKTISVTTMEAFDWTTIWKRGASPLTRFCLKILGPLIALSGITRRENLVVVAQKPGKAR